MIDAVGFLLLISVTLLLGYIGSLLESKTKVPNLLWLLVFGLLIGPVFRLYDPDLFLQITPLMSAVALAIILFDAGINLDLNKVMRALPKAVSLVLFTFLLCVFSIGGFLYLLMPQDFPLLQALLLGAMVGGTSAITVLSILPSLEKTMDISIDAKTMLTLEPTLADPVVIVSSITLIRMIISPETTFVGGITTLLFSFVSAAILGLIIGLGWATVLDRLYGRHLNYMITIAVLFLTYILSEEFVGHGAGPVACLVFGLVLTNFSGILEKFGEYKTVVIEKKELRRFHEEITFFIESFFFVYMGVIVSISITHLAIGLIIVGICLATRQGAVYIAAFLTKFTEEERILSRAIIADGLGALIMSQMPAIYDPQQQYFVSLEAYPNLCFIIVLGMVIYASLVGPCLAQKKMASSGKTQTGSSRVQL
ncbi:MAG: cation:proton antiporter [Thermoproteota archaeon]